MRQRCCGPALSRVLRAAEVLSRGLGAAKNSESPPHPWWRWRSLTGRESSPCACRLIVSVVVPPARLAYKAEICSFALLRCKRSIPNREAVWTRRGSLRPLTRLAFRRFQIVESQPFLRARDASAIRARLKRCLVLRTILCTFTGMRRQLLTSCASRVESRGIGPRVCLSQCSSGCGKQRRSLLSRFMQSDLSWRGRTPSQFCLDRERICGASCLSRHSEPTNGKFAPWAPEQTMCKSRCSSRT
jgi:hypothetical protein